MRYNCISRCNLKCRKSSAAARILQLAVAAISLHGAQTAIGATYDFTGATGSNWNVAADWTLSGGSTHVVPVIGDTAQLGFSGTPGTSVNFNQSYTGAGLALLDIDAMVSSFTLNQTTGGTAMIATNEFIGNTNTENTYNQTAGTNTVTAILTLGNLAASNTNSYLLSGTGSVTATTFLVGNAGSGVITQSAGTLTATNLTMGNTTTGTGFYTLSGTGNATVGTLVAGALGSGTISQSGGNLTITGGLVVGLGNTTSTSSYTMTGGNLNLNNSSPFEIGYGGSGCMSQSAGAITFSGGVNSDLIVAGDTIASTGIYTLSGTGSIGGAQIEAIADIGCGTFTQNAGNNTLAGGGIFYLGGQSGANGTYNLNGGNLSVNQGTEYIGTNGNGTFTQIGGSNLINFAGAVGTGFYVGLNAGSIGNYNLQSGSLTTTFESEYIGNSGNGTFNQTGGTNSVSTVSTASGLFIGNIAGGIGCYTLSGTGALSSGGSEVIGNGGCGTLTQTGGTNTLTNSAGLASLILGNQTGGNGTYNLSGTGVLTSAGNEIIGNNGSGAFTQSGGCNTLTGGAGLFIASNVDNSAYNLQGGNLSVSGIERIGNGASGIFNQTGGNNSAGSNFYLGAASTGTYTLSTGNLSVSGSEYIGYTGVGIFIQYSGIHSISGALVFGSFVGDIGDYNLNNGTLNVLGGNNEVIGDDGSGSFDQFAGLNNITGILIVGQNSGKVSTSASVYGLNGGTITAAGGESIAPGILGQFGQVGGINSINGTGLTIGTFTGAIYIIQAGILSTPSINVNGKPADFQWTGGTLDLIAGVTFDPANTFSTTSTAFGSTLILSTGSVSGGPLTSPMNLIVNGNETIGGGSAFQLVIDAGSTDTATAISVAPTGTLSQLGGNIVGNVTNQGLFYYSGGNFTGQLTNYGNATFVASGTFSNGFINNSVVPSIGLSVTLNFNGAGFTNVGSVALAGATVNATTITNSGLISGYGFIQGSPVSNSGTITQAGGPLTINSLTTGFNNTGTINLATGLQLLISGFAVTNDGFIALNGGTLDDGPGMTNNSDGLISGPGKILGIFANAGTLSVPAGSVNVSFGFANTGLITLSSPSALLTGGGISNTGSIQGAGTIAAQILNNAGIVEAVGGTLTMTGPVTNSAPSTIRTTTGTKILMQGSGVFPLNAGLIDLAGGTFDNGGHTLDNTGTIAGYGVLAASTITNDGAMLFTGGTATINANLVNSATRRIDIKYQPALFTGNITNNGIIKTWSTTVTYTGTLTNNAGSTYASDPATNIFQAGLSNAGTVTGGVGDVYIFSGGPVNNSGNFTNGGTLQSSVNFTNSGTFTQSGPQTWSPGTSFTNTAGLASFESNAKLYGLTITGGTVDLTSSKLIVEDTSAHAATLTSMKAYAGSGALTSSVISSNKTFVISDNAVAGLTTFGGFPVDSGSILETVAYKGDANLDGVVDIKDLQDLANHWQQSVTDWSEGDFNGDGIVDIRDLQALANNWQAGVGSGGGSGQSFSEALSLIGSFGGTSSVPEPLSLALLGLGGVVLASRRRRK